MTPDDITRLADKIAIYADDSIDASRLGRLAHHWEAELRALAAQGKAGGVAEIPTGTKVSVDVSTGNEDFEHRIFATVIGVERGEKLVILCEEESRNFAPPANPPEAGVTEPEWLTALLSEVLVAPMKSNFTLSRDELKHILAPQPKDAP